MSRVNSAIFVCSVVVFQVVDLLFFVQSLNLAAVVLHVLQRHFSWGAVWQLAQRLQEGQGWEEESGSLQLEMDIS